MRKITRTNGVYKVLFYIDDGNLIHSFLEDFSYQLPKHSWSSRQGKPVRILTVDITPENTDLLIKWGNKNNFLVEIK